MPNLVGIGNSQVPTNAMLGGLAYQDSVGEINLDKIKARTSDTAVDVFVYDTRKDSDGGAWRKKATTQSWYNETASATRGARKEFPAVAIIVIETYEIVIYDGDDPNLSMWMRFEMNQLESPAANMGKTPFGLGHTNAYPHNNLNLSCVHMLNGYLFIGANKASNSNQLTAGYDINFVSEIMHEYLHYPGSASNANKWRLAGKVVDRNRTDLSDSPTSRYDGTGYSIQDMVNDVDMIVLPNAPIDQFSGLPVPTVALATEGGASIIMDDGNTYSTNDTLNWSRVNISEANGRKVLNYIFSIGGTVRHKFIDNISADWSRDYEDYPHATASTSVASNGNSDVYGHSTGMMIYKRGNDPGSLSNADYDDAKARVTSSFNTGYMHGDIKSAFLSSTDDTNVTGTELVSNPGPYSNTTGWASANVGFTVSNSNNRLVINSTTNTASYFGAAHTLTLVSGTKYVLAVNIHSQTQTAVIRLTGNGNYFTATGTGTGEHAFYFTANQASNTIFIGSDVSGSNRTQEVSSVSIKEISGTLDHSGNDKGLQVFGTVPKQIVATGAELVSYGPFSTSNRLRQSYNSDLRFETGDFYVMFWMNNSGTNIHQTLVGRDNREFSVDILDNSNYDRKFRIYAFDSSNSMSSFDSNSDPFLPNTWSHVCVNYLSLIHI